MRAMSDAAEAQAIATAYPHLSSSEQTRLYIARKRHKELAVLLHEWAHTMGAIHESGDAFIMDPELHRDSATFSPQSARLIAAAVLHPRAVASAPPVPVT